MVWKHKDICCHTMFCVFLHKSVPETYKPMRVRAQKIPEILAKQLPVMYKRPFLFKVWK